MSTALAAGCGGGESRGDAAPSSASAPAPESEAPPRCLAARPRVFEHSGVRGASTSSIDLVRVGDRTLALVADADEKALHVVDTKDMKQIGVTPLEGRPEHVLAADDGRVLVTLRDAGVIVALEPSDAALTKPFELRCAADVGSDPWAIATDGARVYVTTGFDARLAVLGARSLDLIASVRLPREPRGILIDGSSAFITHAVGGALSVVDLTQIDEAAARISLDVVSATSPQPIDKAELSGESKRAEDARGGPPPTPARRTTQGFAVASVSGTRADGTSGILRLLAPHASSHAGAPQAPPSLGYGAGGVARPVAGFVAVVDPSAKRMISSDAVAPMSQESPMCVLPRGAVAHGTSLYVACLDADVVLELDARLADPMSIARKVIPVPRGPTSVALDTKGSLLVYSAFARTLVRHPLGGDVAASSRTAEGPPSGGTSAETTLWRRTGVARDEALLLGRNLFHTSRDARIGGGRACASCHPEGRDDGLVWSSPDGPRQTPALAGRIEKSAPYGWFGENPNLRDHLDHTFTRLGGTGFKTGKTSAAEIEALMKYVASIELPKRRSGAGPQADLARGKDVYVAYGCQGCHVDGRSDGKTHEVGSGTKGERRAAFDTPSLLGVGSSAPYFHDGRYASLDELLSAKDSRMFSGTISAPDRAALALYLSTL